jgi:hypothetical protein
MAVEVYSANVLGGGSPPVTQFSDTFNRTSGSLGSPDWIAGIHSFTPTVAPVAASTIAIGAGSDGPQAAIWSSVSSGVNPATIWRAFAIPTPIYRTNYGLAQFVQCQFIRNTGAGANEMQAGPAVLMRGDEDTLYYFEIDTVSASFRIVRSIQTTLVAIGSYGTVVVAGDTVRVSVVNSGSSVDFTVTRNGGNLQVISDSSAQRFFTGSPGYYCRGAGGAAPGDHQFRNFVGGLGA